MNLPCFGDGDIGFGDSFIPRITFHNPLFSKIDLSGVKESLDKIDEITEEEWSGLSEWLALNVDGLNESDGGRQTELGFDEKIKILADAYLESGLEFSQEDAVMTLLTAIGNNPRAVSLIDDAGELNEAQMQLALEAAIVMSYSGESIDLIGESGLTPLKGARWTVKNAAGHDFDLVDVRENLDDKFTGFGVGAAARVTGIRYLTEPKGLGRFDQLFNPNLQGVL